MAEWSIAAVLKTVVLRGTRGSNPCLSAINADNQQFTRLTPNFTPKKVELGVFALFNTLIYHFFIFHSTPFFVSLISIPYKDN